MTNWGSAQFLGTRDFQQDVAVCVSIGRALLAVVADGMGGHQEGRRAAELVTEAFVGHITSSVGNWPLRLENAVRAASEALNLAFPDCEEAAPGTTLAAVVFVGPDIWHVSVGDSLILTIKDGKFRRLNADHSMAPLLEAQFEQGLLGEFDLANHPARHRLRSAMIAGCAPALVDCPALPTKFEAGDHLAVMSDGMLSLQLEEIQETILASSSPQSAADALISRVSELALPGQDNASIIIVGHGKTPSRLGWWIAGLATGAALLVGLTLWAARSVGVSLI